MRTFPITMISARWLCLIVLYVAASRQRAAVAEDPVDLLGEVARRQVQFMAKVGELSPNECQALTEEAQRTLGRWGGRVDNAAVGPSLGRELTPILKDISRTAWEKFDAERQRLDVRRRNAALLAQVVELDEALLLTGEQRTALCERLVRPDSDAWWRPENVNPLLMPAGHRVPAAVSRGNLGCFVIPEAELTRILCPAQFAAFKEFQSPLREPVTVVELADAAATWRPVRRVVVRRVPRLYFQLRLKTYLGRFVENADAVCRLSENQRQRLLLAGTLDIERFCDEQRRSDFAEGHDAGVPMPELSASIETNCDIFNHVDSRYQKTLRGRLNKEQKQELATAEDERFRFRRLAFVEAVVVGLERFAALTSDQCDALAAMFLQVISEADEGATGNWRCRALRGIGQIPEENTKPVFFDFQWTAAQKQFMQLIESAEEVEAQAAGQAAVLHGVRGIVRGKDGKSEVEFQADELKLFDSQR
jgi:hypothetical protein